MSTNLYKRFTYDSWMSNMQRMHRFIAPYFRAASTLQHFMYSCIPSFVSEVVAINAQNLETYAIYLCVPNMLSWPRAHAVTRELNDHTWFYYIKVWNNDSCRMESYLLNATHLCKALGIVGIDRMWALSDFGIVSSLAAYMRQHKGQDIFDIGVNGKYMGQNIAPVLSSLRLADNVTKEGLLVYLFYHDFIDTIDIYNAKVVKMNYDLEETPVNNGETL